MEGKQLKKQIITNTLNDKPMFRKIVHLSPDIGKYQSAKLLSQPSNVRRELLQNQLACEKHGILAFCPLNGMLKLHDKLCSAFVHL